MIKADLHCHSEYSDYPSTWMHKLYDSPESFTKVQTLYDQAVSRGMNIVTVTDHDDIRACLELVALYPQTSFISCEVTSYFPEDNCKAHILVYGITEADYDHIMLIRRDIYRLREYLLEQNIAYSVAHANYDQDGKLGFGHIEKLALLFDVFEVRNGASAEQSNQLLHQYLQALTPLKLNELAQKYDIQPINSDSWKKGYTGGSDDHCGLLLGSTYTTATAVDVESFLACLRTKQTLASGRHGSFETYAFGVFKHLHDHQVANNDRYLDTKSFVIFEELFNGYRGNWRERLRKSRSLKYLKQKSTMTHKALFELLKEVSEHKDQDFQHKISTLYRCATNLHDSLFADLMTGLTDNISSGNLFSLFTHLSKIFPATAMLVPFMASMNHQSLKHEIKTGILSALDEQPVKKCLWFTDTIDDLNGVSVTLRQIAEWATRLDYQLQMVTCVDPLSVNQALPENTINFIPIAEHELPFYEGLALRFPSFLNVLNVIAQTLPDKIIISTPGPLGLLGLFIAKLLKIPVEGVYHTDFSNQVAHILGDASLSSIVAKLTTAFYQQFDKVYVPSKEYIDILSQSGIDSNCMDILPRGVDVAKYRKMELSEQLDVLPQLKSLQKGFTILIAGRVSADKNINLVCDVFDRLSDEGVDINLLIAGDGPDLAGIKMRYSNNSRVLCLGRVSPDHMPAAYNFSDLQVFPSRTDTFGMVILEGQACGLPAVVSNSGGPQEIIQAGVTGTVVTTDLPSDWVDAVKQYIPGTLCSDQDIAQLTQQLTQTEHIRQVCLDHVSTHYHWENLLKKMIGADYLLAESSEDDFVLVEDLDYLRSA